jgi:cytoskeletal protein RodZ
VAQGQPPRWSSGRWRVGEELRRRREAFGQTVEDAAQATRIRPAYLLALESGDYAIFPGEIWARLFLKSYAQHLGLDAEPLLAMAFPPWPSAPPAPPASEERREPSPAPSAPPTGARRRRRLRSRRRVWASPWWALGLTLALAAGLTWLVVHMVRTA